MLSPPNAHEPLSLIQLFINHSAIPEIIVCAAVVNDDNAIVDVDGADVIVYNAVVDDNGGNVDDENSAYSIPKTVSNT